MFEAQHQEDILQQQPEVAVSVNEIDYGAAPSRAKREELATNRKKVKSWYIIHTYSGHENKVKLNLERRIESMNMQDKIYRVEVPQKTVTKMKDGKRIEKDEQLFPGYVLVEMLMDDDSWFVVRHTPGVTKFVGAEKRPIPAKDAEIRRILYRAGSPQKSAQKVQIDLKVGDAIRIISGPFADFEGSVTEVSMEKEKIKASVSIFGRETPVELAFNQIVKTN
jgi:transcription termination/antitermination protein NusG